MRPRELTLRGFRSYADETRFDLGGRRLVGIVGPIGAGKSSILDAIAFALYGKTPKSGTNTKALISQRRDSLHVELVFEVDGTTWKVVRALRRSGAAAHTLYVVEDGVEREVADKARDVTERIEALLGLEFEAFRRSVLLAQNQFAGFLEATPVERNQVLKGVFGFDRLDAMRGVVKGRLDAIGVSLAHLTARRASAEADRKRRDELSLALAAAEERVRTLDALRVGVLQAQEVLRSAESEEHLAIKAVTEIDEIAARIPQARDTESLFAAAAASSAAVAQATAALDAASGAVAAAEADLDAAFTAVGGRGALQEAGDLVARVGAARDALQGATERRNRVSADAATAAGVAESETAAAVQADLEVQSAEAAVAVASAAEEAARSALHAAHEADRAAGLRTGLRVGEPCPVCLQAVASVPVVAPSQALGGAESAVAKAVEETAARRKALVVATAVLARSRASGDAAARRIDELSAELGRLDAEANAAVEAMAALERDITARLGAGDPVDLLDRLRVRVTAAEEAVRGARTDEGVARRAREEAVAQQKAAAGALDRLRTDLATIAGRLGTGLDFGDDADGIAAALRELRDECLRRGTAAAEARDRAHREAGAARAARTDLLVGAGLGADDDIVEVTHEAAREATELGAEVRVLERNLAELESLGVEEADAVSRRALLDRLHGDLLDARFVKWVLDEQRRVLADLGGLHLETLTAGRYRFSEDGEFDVIDLTAADLVRSAASLSGGETFLASLALALALAEIVSQEGGRLDAFFLDEGFGSLDPEHLDLAMDGVERLVASGADRLVVVVSHVPALRERFEDLIVLDRDAVTGVTRVVSGSGVV
jgi:DNA repair protein SbcC/Rad50